MKIKNMIHLCQNNKESGGIKAIKNTIKLKSKQFSVKRSIIEKSFNAIEMINDCIKSKDIQSTSGTNYCDPLTNKASLSCKLGINIPVYHLSDKKKPNKFMYTPTNYTRHKNDKRMSSKFQSKRAEIVLVQDQTTEPLIQKCETFPKTNGEKDKNIAKLKTESIAASTIVMPTTPASFNDSRHSAQKKFLRESINPLTSTKYSHMLKEKIRENSPNNKRASNHSRKGSENKAAPFLKYSNKEFKNREHKNGIYTIVKRLNGQLSKTKNNKREDSIDNKIPTSIITKLPSIKSGAQLQNSKCATPNSINEYVPREANKRIANNSVGINESKPSMNLLVRLRNLSKNRLNKEAYILPSTVDGIRSAVQRKEMRNERYKQEDFTKQKSLSSKNSFKYKAIKGKSIGLIRNNEDEIEGWAVDEDGFFDTPNDFFTHTEKTTPFPY